MNAGALNPQSLSFSTRDMPEKERVPYWREVFGRHIIRVEFEPRSDEPFEARAMLWSVPGLRAHWPTYKGPARLRRTRELIAQTDESVALLIDRKGSLRWSQRGAETQLVRSSAVIALQTEPAEMNLYRLPTPPWEAHCPLGFIIRWCIGWYRCGGGAPSSTWEVVTGNSFSYTLHSL